MDSGRRLLDACDDDPVGTRASVGVSSINVMNNILGAGLFSMPWCLKEATAVTGVLLLALVALLNGFSFVILARCCDLSQTFNYRRMGQLAFGPAAGQVIQLCTFFYTCGSCVSYVILVADFLIAPGTGVLVLWLDLGEAEWRAAILSGLGLLVLLPLSLLKNLSALRFVCLPFCLFVCVLFLCAFSLCAF